MMRKLYLFCLFAVVCGCYLLFSVYKTSPTTLRVRNYEMALLINKSTVSVLDFVELQMKPPSASYRWRCFNKKTGLLTSGQGSVNEKYKRTKIVGGIDYVEDQGSNLTIAIGNESIKWSVCDKDSCWLYFHHATKIFLIDDKKFNTIDLKKIMESGNND